MDENKAMQQMTDFNNDLIQQTFGDLMGDIDIDIDSITLKAHQKMEKEKITMKNRKRRIASLIAACLVVTMGMTYVYAAEISEFVKSLMGKTGVYSTIVDGSTYYLHAPLDLDNGHILEKAMFDRDTLELKIITGTQNAPNISVIVNGKEMGMDSAGYMGEEDGMSLFFLNVSPASSFDIIVDGKRYAVALASSTSVVDGSNIIEAVPNDIQWIHMGYKKIENGIQIFTTFDDSEIRLNSLVIPQSDRVTQTIVGNYSGERREEFQPLIGYDRNGNSYEYSYDPNDMGRPLTMFTSSAPANTEMSVKVPGISVSTDKNVTLTIPIPTDGKDTSTQTVDLGLQSMTLQSIERTSDITATLIFKLNTGKNNNVRLWHASADNSSITSGEFVWENGVCTMEVAFDEGMDSLKMVLEAPIFLVDGNWVLN